MDFLFRTYKKSIEVRSRDFTTNRMAPRDDFRLFLKQSPARTALSKALFDIYPLCRRVAENGLHLTPALTAGSYLNRALSARLLAGKRRPATKAGVVEKVGAQEFVLDVPVDRVLLGAPKLASLEGLATWFSRTFAVFYLQREADRYVCELRFLDDFAYRSADFERLGCRVVFGAEPFRVVELVANGRTFRFDGQAFETGADDDLVRACRTVLSATLQYGTIIHHATMNHFVIADDVLYSFANHVFRHDEGHFLVPLLGTLAHGTVEVNDLAHVMLVNLGKPLISVVTAFTPVDIKQMIETTAVTPDQMLDFPALVGRLGAPAEGFPVVRTLAAWWEVLHAFCQRYVAIGYPSDHAVSEDARVSAWLRDNGQEANQTGLTALCTRLFFNNVVHTLFSNPTFVLLLEDPVNRVTTPLSATNPDGIADEALTVRVILTFLSTAGETFKWMDKPISDALDHPVTDSALLDCFARFHQQVVALAHGWEGRGYVDTLHPSNVACGVAW